jgi:hypothetical protein
MSGPRSNIKADFGAMIAAATSEAEVDAAIDSAVRSVARNTSAEIAAAPTYAATCAAAFRFLRQPSRPNAPSAVVKRGKAVARPNSVSAPRDQAAIDEPK